MFIAHLPSGYIFADVLLRNRAGAERSQSLIILAAVLGAVAPDFDLIYFYLIDNRQTHHHMYWSHYPLVWLSLLAGGFALHSVCRGKLLGYLLMVVAGGGILHLLLDSVVGDIWWLAPFVDQPFSLFVVPARYDPWWLNFILHGSFLLEILISLYAYRTWKEKHGHAG